MTEETKTLVGWSKKRLGNLFNERSKSKIQVSEASNHGLYPFYTSGDKVLIHDKFLIEDKNIFLSTGGVANVKFYEGQSAYSTDTYAIYSKEQTNTKYLYYFILNKLYYINNNYFLGSGLKHLQKKDFKQHVIILPKDVSEQQKIAEVLTKVDEAIIQTEQLIAKYQHIKTGLMQDLLTKGIDKNGNIRSEETHEFKSSPLGRIPVDWNNCTINSVNKYSTSGSRGWAKYYSTSGKNFVTITSLNREDIRIDANKIRYVQLPNNAEGSRSKLEEGDILISITADLGIIGLYTRDLGESYINQHIALVRLDQERVRSKFIAYYLSSPIGQLFFNFMNDGGAKAGLNLNTILQIPIAFPSKDEQLLIVDKIDKSILDIDNLTNQSNKLNHLKKGLMQDLLSGKKRVTSLLNNTNL